MSRDHIYIYIEHIYFSSNIYIHIYVNMYLNIIICIYIYKLCTHLTTYSNDKEVQYFFQSRVGRRDLFNVMSDDA